MTKSTEISTAPAAKRPRKDDKNTSRWVAAGAAMGIGSAALVAALLYKSRDAKKPDAAMPSGQPPETD
jgi:hypothetical protein